MVGVDKKCIFYCIKFCWCFWFRW